MLRAFSKCASMNETQHSDVTPAPQRYHNEVEQCVFACNAQLRQKSVLEFAQMCQHCITRVIDCSNAVIHIKKINMCLYKFTNSPYVKKTCSQYRCYAPSNLQVLLVRLASTTRSQIKVPTN